MGRERAAPARPRRQALILKQAKSPSLVSTAPAGDYPAGIVSSSCTLKWIRDFPYLFCAAEFARTMTHEFFCLDGLGDRGTNAKLRHHLLHRHRNFLKLFAGFQTSHGID